MSKISIETEYDKAVTELARSIAMCDNADCHGEKCKTCPIWQQQSNVLESMPDIYKIRVLNELTILRAYNPPNESKTFMEEWRDDFLMKCSVAWDCRGPILLVLIFLFVMFVLPFLLWGEEYSNYKIQNALRQTSYNIKDVTGDNKINCMDFAIVFKHMWDSSNPPEDCELVRNLSKDFNHLFVRIRTDAGWVYVEPSAHYYGCINQYTMNAFWEDKYDARFNFYNETDYWMKYEKYPVKHGFY